jgi:DNA repair photolyase
VPRPVSNPRNPWATEHVEWLGEPPPAELCVYEEEARQILSENESPDLPFRWSLNPYRGCYHGCSYCYARTTHQFLGWGAGTDFERRIIAKTNAPALLRKRFEQPSWRGERIAFSGVTDCYQPLEATYGLTRACLEVCRDYRNPVVVLTKGALVRRDVDLLAQLSRESHAMVYLSIPFAQEQGARAMEPWASPIASRFEALKVLSEAGVTTGVSLAPLIPGLNDSHVPEILERARESGARHAFQILLRLQGEVETVFLQRLEAALPGRARKVRSALDDMRRGQGGRSGFGTRMVGSGSRWKAVADLFELHCRRLGMGHREVEGRHVETFRRPGSLFPS